MEQGIDISNEEYQIAKGLSYSGLKRLAISPAHYKTPKEYKSDPIFNAVHMAILEPERFDAQVITVGDRRKKENKAKILEAEEKCLIVLRDDELETCLELRRSVERSVKARALCSLGVNEKSFFGAHELGFRTKCRPDALWEKAGVIVDLKGFYDLRTDNIERQIYRMQYHWQAAWYQDVMFQATGQRFGFLHVFYEASPPYGIRIVALHEAALEKAREEYKPLTQLYAECLEKNEWPSYSDEIAEVGLPSFAW